MTRRLTPLGFTIVDNAQPNAQQHRFGKLNDQASVLRIFAAHQAVECAEKLVMVSQSMRAGVNPSPMSPDFFHMQPDEDEWISQVKEVFQIGSRAP